MRSWHALLLRSALLSTNPLWPVVDEQLGIHLVVVEEAVVVKGSRLGLISRRLAEEYIANIP
jgi:hypothetical protein